MEVPKALAEAAIGVASAVNADAILLQTETGTNCDWLLDKMHSEHKQIKLIVATSSNECLSKLAKNPEIHVVRVPAWQAGRIARAGQLVAQSLQQGDISEGQRLVFLLGDGCPDLTDLIKVWDVRGDEYAASFLSNNVMASVIELAIEIASFTNEDKRRIGAAFMVGDAKSVMRFSYQLMIDPFQNQQVDITARNKWDIIKKYAANFDGAFVVDSEGMVVAAQRYLNAFMQQCDIPAGLGTRHRSVALMSAATASRGVTVSQEDGMVRIFEGGKLVARINPSSQIVECFKDYGFKDSK